jgi:HD superfamily phosphohydrolase
MPFRKIVNDPVHGFITIDDPLIHDIVSHPWYQRMRRISQMGLSHLVYPGAVHSRLHHSLGAFHLMTLALQELRAKGVDISPEEERGARIAILLHDIGHGPFSHALESQVIEEMHHEALSLRIMERLDAESGGRLSTAIDIFRGVHPKPFLHQLVSGQLDVDRMDYLARDSFFTGVIEGTVGYDRIIKMLAVHDGSLVVEEKAVHSIEKFLVSRRLMYWQVYLHKTVIAAEVMLARILERARRLHQHGDSDVDAGDTLGFFLFRRTGDPAGGTIAAFCELDDTDVIAATKRWARHPDRVLSLLCRSLLDRRLYKLRLRDTPVPEAERTALLAETMARQGLDAAEASYLCFTGEAENRLYDPDDERIHILFRDGRITDISRIDHALIHHTLSKPVKKFYICHHPPNL